MTRTPPRKKAKQLARYLRDEQHDYAYLKPVFKNLREQLDITVSARRSPYRLFRMWVI